MSPHPLPAALLSRIEDAGLNASAPTQQRWLDGWLVRLSPGKAKRARCINAVATGALSLPEKLAQCQALYRSAGLRMLFRVTPFSQPPGLDDWLAQRGYQRFDDTGVMVCPTLSAGSSASWPDGLQLEHVSPEAYAYIVGESRHTPAEGCAAHADRLRHSPVPYSAVVLRDGEGQVVAGAQVALEAELAGLYDVFTVTRAQGRGLSRQLCAHLLAQAHAQGARVAYLQVDAGNLAARAVYRRLGFSDAYSYHYRALPSVDD